MCRLAWCEPDKLSAWMAAEPWLKPAVEQSQDVNLEDVRMQYSAGLVVLGLLIDDSRGVFGAMITEVQRFARRSKMIVHFFGASPHSDWSLAWLELQETARAQGCQVITGIGRQGWGKMLGGKIEHFAEFDVPDRPAPPKIDEARLARAMGG